jgi:ubiquitin C-terminal hydrolase
MGKKKARPDEDEEQSSSLAAADADPTNDAADDAEDDDNATAHAGVCKHAAKHIKASSIRAHLKKIPALVAAKRSSVAPTGKSKGSSKATVDAPELWLCLACSQLDVDAKTHFDRKHPTGFELVSMGWRCFPCNMSLHDGNLPPKALEKMRLVTQQVETEMKKAGATAPSASAAAAAQTASSKAAAAAPATASPVAAAASSSGSGIIVKGLRNLSNTCFFNSVMQCLASTTALYGTMLYPSSSLYDDRAISMQAPLQRALLHFLQAMQAPPKAPPPPPPATGKKQKYLSRAPDESRVVVPSELLSAVQAINPMFRGNRQHDSHELLRTVLNGITLEKEEELRKQKQAATNAVFKTWSAERVLQWIESWGLSCYETVATNLLTDADRTWDGQFLLWLLANWQNKPAKQPRLVLHRGVESVEDKRLIARNLQRLKDGNLPAHMMEPHAQMDAEQPTAEPAADSAALHPHESVLQSTFIHSLFGGVLRNTVECLACNTRSTTHELFMDLSLAIEAPRLMLSRQEMAALAASTKVSASTVTASAAEKKKPPAPASSTSAISKARNKKHQSKSQRRMAKRNSRRASSARSTASGSASKENSEGEEEEGEEEEEGAEPSNAEEKKDDGAADEKQSSETAASGDAAAPADTALAAAALDSTLSVAAPTADSTAVPADSSSGAPESVAAASSPSDLASVTDAVANLTLAASTEESSAAQTTDSTDSTTTSAASESSASVATQPAAAEPSSSSPADAVVSPASSSPAVSSVPCSSSGALSFLTYARSHRLGMDRLAGGRDRSVTIADCLAAYTDPDLLTGSNKYGCRECSKRAQEAQAANTPAASASSASASAARASPSPSASPAPVAKKKPSVDSVPPVADSSPAAASSAAPEDAGPPAAAPVLPDGDSTAAPTERATCDAQAANEGDSSKPDDDSADDSAAIVAASSSPASAAASSSTEEALEEIAPAEVVPPPPVWIKQDAVKRTRILVPPTVLTLHLKRSVNNAWSADGWLCLLTGFSLAYISVVFCLFVPLCSFHQNGRSLEKSSRGVDFPLCFNLADYCAAPIPAADEPSCVPGVESNDSHSARAPDCFYHLYGIVSHGGGMGGGHYVSYMRKSDVAAACASDHVSSSHASTCCAPDAADLSSGWVYASDSDTRPVSVAEIKRVQAYILFYQKC